ncbi:MAG: hypothetical protein PHN68_07295 [Prolixibacteraceae bacterium]|nr:hypothetical protein [Prolixibacteraceae bacterium]NLO02733.1 hypothetical protein [Bacteroidales bacterium]
MEMISRRKFLRQTAGITAGLTIQGNYLSAAGSVFVGKNYEVFIPIPLQVVIDDVGWWSGEDGHEKQEPYRTGINRKHVPADYQAIADLGKALGIRPQAATILCEWDKENILRDVPSSTWMGRNWDNSGWVGPWMEEAAEIIRSNQKYYELTLHGVGHEFWEGEKFTRAEWHDRNGHMRPREEVEKHLDYYEKLLRQHNLGLFPKSFVPAAFLHSFGPSEGNATSLALILKRRGVDYINTPFGSIFNKERVQYGIFGIDDDVMTVDRGRDEFSWMTFPGDPSKELTGPTCGMHWPNMLHPDPLRNSEVVKKWIDYLRPFNDKQNMMLAPDSVYFQHQLAHHTLTKINLKGNIIELDFSATDNLPANIGRKEFTVKIITCKPVKLKPAGIKILSRELKKGKEFMYVLKLMRKPDKSKAIINILT